MQIKRTASAGTLESGDIMVLLDQGEKGIEVQLSSTVKKQYGQQIRDVIIETLIELETTDVKVVAHDRGALDCTIRARVMAAFYRATESTDYRWGGE